jgi:hypothetical protein
MPLALTLITSTSTAAASPQEQRGKAFAPNNCTKVSFDRRDFAKLAPDRTTVPDAAHDQMRINLDGQHAASAKSHRPVCIL